ncbi:uncharacterized protein PFL1_04167 [Pseudozyma flocculosa PF-1]|uniref:Tubulin-specific chaperone A n=2 Tax=Pseudozyma flocculosa TaxID=84751 RepID=A0A5C3EWL5_9BASI|nr:uncharacterized protein PFL1_04167 [Pseudozyma flocculosa PF-1]EPQ28340.1 hypothetical protein PFL1_04167 [Pseudozyma flocculosa PF-1]SPO35491.1 related to Tubulin-specific chaperone A [Pseudozyma flocculosa]
MSDTAALKRQLQIKTGVVKRLTAESASYVQEAEEQQRRVDKFVAEGRDEWDVKKQREVLEDCRKMIPDCRKRLEKATEDLEVLLEGIGNEDAALEEEVKTAQSFCDKARQSLKA